MIAPRFSGFLTALGLAAMATLFALVGQNALWPVRFWCYDVGFNNRVARAPADIVILGIDERFMAGRHAYLAPRDRLAKLLENLAEGKPKAIALDVWLDSRIDDRQNGDYKLKSALRAIKKRGIPLILADLPPTQTEYGADSRNGQTATGAVIPFFAREARTGGVLFTPDVDGAVREHSSEDFAAPSLPLQMALLGGGHPLLNRHSPAMLDFCGPPGTIQTQSAADFLAPELAPLVAGQLVFIGATYPRSLDLIRTPYSGEGSKPMYGVEVLAQATDSLRRGTPFRSDLTRPARWFDFSLVFMVCFGLALAALRGNLAGIVMTFFVLLAAFWGAIISARNGGVWESLRFHDATPWLQAAPLVLAGGIGWRSWKTARELRLVRDTFGAYMGIEILESLGGKMPELGGETREIAVLFCDIRGYSALAEAMADDPKALLDELNAHFSPLVGALKKRGAYVDNYVGDLVMAVFGAPVSAGSFEADVRAATLAALDFVHLVEARNEKRAEQGQMPIEVGIGVHCGVAVVGNMGTRDQKLGGRIHYTAIGDVVNVASRVESATRGQNVALLVTKEVVEVVGEDAESEDAAALWRRVGQIVVKGRSAPVEIYEIAA